VAGNQLELPRSETDPPKKLKYGSSIETMMTRADTPTPIRA